MVAVTPWDIPTSEGDKPQAFAWPNSPRKLEATLARSSKENRATAWRYASLITPAALRPLESGAGRNGDDNSDQQNHSPGGPVGKPSARVWREGVQQDGEGFAGSAAARFCSSSGETHKETEEHGGYFRRKLAALVGGRRGRVGPGPGAALWMPSSRAKTMPLDSGGDGTGSPLPRPKKAKIRRLVRHLEAELKLKGRPGAGGLPEVGSQRVDFPYTKELAKWSYDEILGIPRATAVPASSRLF